MFLIIIMFNQLYITIWHIISFNFKYTDYIKTSYIKYTGLNI